MKQTINNAIVLVFGFILWVGVPANAQNFSCSYGDRPSCLGFGETVCSSFGKCVKDNAICFDSYTCNYEGFTCKSNLTDLGDEYDDLVRRFNNLLSKNDNLVFEYNSLLAKHNDLVDDYNDVLNDKNDLRDCLLYSSNIDEAQTCLY